ncbi:hypothetical protein MRX96_014198 [Rhipicephalus microplus]
MGVSFTGLRPSGSSQNQQPRCFFPLPSRVCRRYFTCDSTNGIGDHGCVAALPATRVGHLDSASFPTTLKRAILLGGFSLPSKPPPVSVMASCLLTNAAPGPSSPVLRYDT